ALAPGEEKVCTVTIAKEDLRLYDRESDSMLIPADVTIYVGRNAADAENTVLKPE
ncbi:MAG: fibronectin type III-like domain-contianing protein, partial [Clostridia bacterium]|nr:fibronectin type III-like domain-contianing protein [Clostridia bacterium]